MCMHMPLHTTMCMPALGFPVGTDAPFDDSQPIAENETADQEDDNNDHHLDVDRDVLDVELEERGKESGVRLHLEHVDDDDERVFIMEGHIVDLDDLDECDGRKPAIWPIVIQLYSYGLHGYDQYNDGLYSYEREPVLWPI